MAKLFLTLFFIIVLFKISFAYAEPHCSHLFLNINPNSIQATAKNTLGQAFEDQLQTLLLNDVIVTRIDNARENQFLAGGSDPSTNDYVFALKDATDLIYKNGISNSERISLSTGINKILDDLDDIPRKYIPTKQLLNEDVAIIIANAKHGDLKEITNKHEGNVAILGKNKIKLNSDYIRSRSNVLKLIDPYIQENSMPEDLKFMRIQDMLYADVRYQLLKAFEREDLVYRIVNLIEEASRPPIEDILEKYYSHGKVRDL